MNKNSCATLHLKANAGEVASTIIMVGDPGRAKNFAQDYLEDAKLICNIREVNLWTGKVNGKEVSVMAHGMGASSVGIYADELFKSFDVERVIRLGTCGMYVTDLELGGILVGNEYYTYGNFGEAYGYEIDKPIQATPSLVKVFEETLEEESIPYRTGGVYTSQWFYAPELINGGVKSGSIIEEKINDGTMVAKEMEGYVVQAIANYYGKEAITILTGINNMTLKIFNDIDSRKNNDAMLHVAKKVLAKIL